MASPAYKLGKKCFKDLECTSLFIENKQSVSQSTQQDLVQTMDNDECLGRTAEIGQVSLTLPAKKAKSTA